jgi:hypothetical protein
VTSPPPTRLNLNPKLRLNYWPDISQTEVLKMILVKEKTLPSWVDAGVEFDSEELLEREDRGRKPSFPPEKEENFKIELYHM